MEFIQYSFLTLVILSMLFSIYYSVRYRRQRDPKLRGLFNAKLNISMGMMLIFLALTQLFLFQDTALRRTMGIIFLLIGLFNLFAGLRNLRAAHRTNQ